MIDVGRGLTVPALPNFIVNIDIQIGCFFVFRYEKGLAQNARPFYSVCIHFCVMIGFDFYDVVSR